MSTKLRDIAVKTGEYQDRATGQTKGRWQNVGALMKADDGNEFIILHRWFNPAGVPNPDNRDSLVMPCFRPNRQDQQGTQQQAAQQQPQGGQQQPPQPGGFSDFDDEIPFMRLHPLMGG